MPTLKKNKTKKTQLKKAYELMFTSKCLTELYEEQKKITGQYVHATSRGHEAIQLAVGMQLLAQDYVYPYYRDESMLLGMNITPYELMLQLLAKKEDPFSAGRIYYVHPSLRDDHRPKIPFQSSATGMQGIPATGAALGLQYKEQVGLAQKEGEKPVVVCSFGDASITEGEVSEAFQMAALRQLPILYLVQDNGWNISAHIEEFRAQNAAEYMKGFKGIKTYSIDGTDFDLCYKTVQEALNYIRTERRPVLIHAKVPLLNHHTSGVRKEWYRDDLETQWKRDPLPKLRKHLLKNGFTEKQLLQTETQVLKIVKSDFAKAVQAPDPTQEDLYNFQMAPTPVTEERGIRNPKDGEIRVMVDHGLMAVKEIMESNLDSLLYGQDVGIRLGGVFREASTLAERFGSERVFNTPIQEAFIIGSTAGMAAVGLKPIVEVQFADYIWPGLNQLFTEVSRSYYLSNGKWPISCVIRVPIGAYGAGGPYHSSSVESVLTNIGGIKIAYPSNGADLKGLMKSAWLDPNPVVMLEHKGLYWSKVPGTDLATNVEPDSDYVIPFGKGRMVHPINNTKLKENSLLVVTYGMGVHWAIEAAKEFTDQVSVLDLRSLAPLDTELIFAQAKKHGKVLVVTEEPVNNTFAQSIAARIQENCFEYLDAPVITFGSKNMPAIPLNSTLEKEMIGSSAKVGAAIKKLLTY